jgi:hypothetical protein
VDKETAEALEQSIKHWEENAAGLTWTFLNPYERSNHGH